MDSPKKSKATYKQGKAPGTLCGKHDARQKLAKQTNTLAQHKSKRSKSK